MLTPRQLEVARYVSQGWTDKQIAVGLGIAVKTVKNHVAAVGRALDVDPARNRRVLIATTMQRVA